MVFILLTAGFALMLAVAQSLWKLAVTKNELKTFDAATLVTLLFSPYFLIGAVLYVIAIVVYLYALSHFEFHKIQAVAVPLTLIFSMIAAGFVFHESIKLTSIIGMAVIILGVYLVVAR
jgi:drug/metabolite transporter (DMT)-like permease